MANRHLPELVDQHRQALRGVGRAQQVVQERRLAAPRSAPLSVPSAGENVVGKGEPRETGKRKPVP